MNRSVFRFLSLILCFVMIFSLAACGKGADEPAAPVSKTIYPELSAPPWDADFLTLQSDSLWSLRPVMYTEDGFYATAQMILGKRELPEGQVPEYEGQDNLYGTVICFVGNDGTVTPLPNYVPGLPEANPYGYRDFYSYRTLGHPVLNSDGNLAVLEQYEAGWYVGPDAVYGNDAYYEDSYFHRESHLDYLILDTTGAEISRATVALEPGSAFVNTSAVAPGPDGSILTTMDRTLLCIGKDGTVLWTVDAGDNLTGLVTLADGSIGATGYQNGSAVLRTVDIAAHSLAEGQSIPDSVWAPIPGNGEYDLFFSGGISLFGLRLGEDPVPILNWLDCDINGQILDATAVSVDGDGTVRGLVSDYEDGREVTQLFTIRPIPEDAVPKKTVLTLAQLDFYPDYSLVNRILHFNRNRDDVRIAFRDYSLLNTDENPTGGQDALLDDILNGNAPDLIPIGTLPYRRLASQGLLEDLYPRLDADPELKRDDFFPNVLAALECGGGLYQAVSGFSVDTLAGPSELVGDTPGWTWDEFFTVQERMPEGSSILNPYTVRSDVLSILLSRDFDRFVDWSKAECDFENDDFRQLLRFAALFPADVNQEAADTAMDAGDRFREQKQMLAQSFLYSPDALLWNSSYLEGIPCTYVGWPVSEGVGSILRPDTGFAMSSTCRDKDAAWEFLRGLLTEAGQKEVSSLPTNRSVFEARLQELMTTEYVTDAAGNQMLDEAGKPLQQSRVSWYDEEGVQHNVYSMSAEQAEQVRQIVEGCTRLAGYDREIFETVLEQAERFFSGELSEDDVARLVQSNVSDYMRGQAGSVSGTAPDHP